MPANGCQTVATVVYCAVNFATCIAQKAKKVMPSLECYHSTLNAMGCDAEDLFMRVAT